MSVAPNSKTDVRRASGRVSHEKMDRILFCCSLDGTPRQYEVINLNSFGALIALGPNETLSVGSIVKDIELRKNVLAIGKYGEARVAHCRLVDGLEHVGLVFQEAQSAKLNIGDRRKTERVRVLGGFAPQASCAHPYEFDVFLVFKVLEITATGATLSTSAGNHSLLRGSQLKDLQIYFPTIGMAVVDADVQHLRQDAQGPGIRIGVWFTKVDGAFAPSVIKYLLNFGDFSGPASIQTIRRAGFSPKRLKTHIQFGTVKSPEDYRQVLELRKLAYTRSGKMDPNTSTDSMSDIYDLNSKIIVARHRGEVVGSVRITFCAKEADRFELDASIELPKNLNRGRTAEISRLCVSDDFENTDLVLGLFERGTELVNKAGIEHIITSCIEEMLPFYKKIAFYPTGKRFQLATLNNIPHYLLLHDCRSHQVSFRLNPVYWHYTFRNIVGHLSRFGFVTQKMGLFKRLIRYFLVNFHLVERRLRRRK